MSKKDKLLNHIKTNGKDRTWNQLANLFGYNSGDSVRKLVKRECDYKKYTIGNLEDSISVQITSDNKTEEYNYNTDKDEIEFKHVWDHAPTPEEVIEHHNIDESKWKLSNLWAKMTSTGYLTSALFSKKKSSDVTPDDMLRVLNQYKTIYKPLTRGELLINNSFGRKCCAFIDITDFHLDKLTTDGESIETRIENYYNILNTLLYRAYSSFYLDEITFVVGSDWFHTDNFQNSTTNGTPQDTSISWDKAYEIGFDMYVNTINKMKQFCNKLNVILVQGNHDRTKSFYVAHALSKYFETDKNIVFDISTESRKVYCYGETFIGLHHGNCKINDLPLVFSQQFYKEWGQCKYHEIKVGDKHFYMEKEIKGIRIKQLPSLSGADQWHSDNNFVENIRAGIVTVYDKEYGKVAEYEDRIHK